MWGAKGDWGKAPSLGWFPTIALMLEHNIKVFVVVFLVFGGKSDADILATFTLFSWILQLAPCVMGKTCQ